MRNNAKQFLLAVEKECHAVELYINAKKTKYMTYNTTEEVQLSLWLRTHTQCFGSETSKWQLLKL